jgi:hypothetical protein
VGISIFNPGWIAGNFTRHLEAVHPGNNQMRKMKGKLLMLVAVAGVLLLLAGFVNRPNGKTSFETARETIIMRQIAHRVLQYSGDSSTPVLPVTRLSENEWLITFQSSFSFKPDSLVQIIGQIIISSGLPSDYIVQVTEPQSHKVVFGYAILDAGQKNIVPCSGRDQPAKPYTILISFRERSATANHWLMATGIALLLPVAFVALRRKRRPPVGPDSEPLNTGSPDAAISIGKYLFYPETQKLVLGGISSLLTEKESKLLSIFASAPNEVVDRNRLQMIWEEEGVIVGRSLDVFVSRLRKRLDGDPLVKIVSIHGKGYRMEINEVKR